jgi:hypothetical protein
LTPRDLAIIEQVLSEAVNNGTDYQKALAYRELLTKLQKLPLQFNGMAVVADANQRDGFRYDYDDNAGL